MTTPSPRTAALLLLSRRDYTTEELRTKLLDREYAAPDIDETLRRLTEERLVDDRRVAAAHVRTSSGVKGRGRLRIKRELEARGITRATAQEAVAAIDELDEAAAIDRYFERKRLPTSLDPAMRRRLFQQLLRRGFSADAIGKAFNRRRRGSE